MFGLGDGRVWLGLLYLVKFSLVRFNAVRRGSGWRLVCLLGWGKGYASVPGWLNYKEFWEGGRESYRGERAMVEDLLGGGGGGV